MWMRVIAPPGSGLYSTGTRYGTDTDTVRPNGQTGQEIDGTVSGHGTVLVIGAVRYGKRYGVFESACGFWANYGSSGIHSDLYDDEASDSLW